MPRRKDCKYNRKYCKQLKRGLRIEGLSIPEVCQIWGICRTTYNKWVEQYPEFKEAHDHGQRDNAAYWNKLARDVASGKVKGNAGVLCFSLKNVDGVGWQDKVEVNSNTQEQIRQINISILPAPVKALTNIIEHEIE